VSLAPLARRAGTRCGAPSGRGVWYGAAQQSCRREPNRQATRRPERDKTGDSIEAISSHRKKPLIEREIATWLFRLGWEHRGIYPYFGGFGHRTLETKSNGRARRCTILASVKRDPRLQVRPRGRAEEAVTRGPRVIRVDLAGATRVVDLGSRCARACAIGSGCLARRDGRSDLSRQHDRRFARLHNNETSSCRHSKPLKEGFGLSEMRGPRMRY
jgi:hypothetical protein